MSNVLAQVVLRQTWIWELLGSNLCRTTD